MVKISVSEKRNPVPRKIEIGNGTFLTSWGAIKVNKSHFFPSSFQVKNNDCIIYIDPVEVGHADKADYILITHAHPDHFSRKDIEGLIKASTKVIAPKRVLKKLKGLNNEKYIIGPMEELSFEALKLETTAAYNVRPVFLWIKAHPKSKGNVGYILTLNKDTRIYHAGDTDYIPEMKAVGNIDVAMVPIGGDNLTMNEEEAAKITNEIAPSIVIPMHYEIDKRAALKRFGNLVNEQIKVVELE